MQPTSRDAITVRPANEAAWEDLQDILGARGEPARCQCQWFRTPAAQWRALSAGERAGHLLRHPGRRPAPRRQRGARSRDARLHPAARCPGR
jgi:hypothetical protein